jgi:hypothetical protein
LNDQEDQASREGAQAQLQKAVAEITNAGVFQGARLEARVAWALNYAVLIGQIRESMDKSAFRWVVTGDEVPTDHVDGHVAENPREALRHFCLKWQLGAEKVKEASVNDPDTGEEYRARADQLAKRAEDLYEIAQADQFWEQP